MKRYFGIIIVITLFTITFSITPSLGVENGSESIVPETELRYFDVTTLKYGEEPDLGIPEEYKVPVKVAFELAKIYRDNQTEPETEGEFTGDYVIAYDFSYDYYEYGFVLVDAEQGGLDLEYVANNMYELGKIGTVKVSPEDIDSGWINWTGDPAAYEEYSNLATDESYTGYRKGSVKPLYFVSADKRGEFRVHTDSKRGLPIVIGSSMRYVFDEAAKSLLGNGITNVVFSSRPSSIVGVIAIESNGERLFIEHWKGYNYYVNEEAFKAPKIYEKVIKDNLEPLDETENIRLWNDFEAAFERGDIPRDILTE
jgi:hypothetical protein